MRTTNCVKSVLESNDEGISVELWMLTEGAKERTEIVWTGQVNILRFCQPMIMVCHPQVRFNQS